MKSRTWLTWEVLAMTVAIAVEWPPTDKVP